MTVWGPNETATSQGTCASFNTLDTGAHTYAEEGDYSAVANYTSSNGARTTAFSVHVADAALTGTGTTISTAPGSSFSGVVAHFDDANPNGVSSDYTATINWGDGSSSPGTAHAGATGFDVTGS
ncbi:MAG TPA: hypothetical protein VIM18_00415, partial [Solirubrobacteraceae bacterium]